MFHKPFSSGLHLAFIIIVAGALVTHFTGTSGRIHLRQGESVSSFIRKDGTALPLPFAIRLDSFAITSRPGSETPSDYISSVTIEEGSGGQAAVPATISVNKILKHKGFRFCQWDYDKDGNGTTLAVSHDPWGVGITYAGYLLLLVCLIGFFFQKGTEYKAALGRVKSKYRFLPPALALIGCFAVFYVARVLFGKMPQLPVLQTPLLPIHVLSIMLSYGIFLLVAGVGIAGVAVKSQETSARLRDVSLTVLLPAVFLLVFGTFLGAVWANNSWGSYWSWDPKETWALITMLVYSLPLHGASLKLFSRPRFYHWFCIAAFLCVLMTYFGVNLFLGGLHSYA